jgi:hypothetical protein
MKKDSKAINIIGIPEKVRFNFKLACWQNQTSMTAVLIEVMKYLGNDPQRIKAFLGEE